MYSIFGFLRRYPLLGVALCLGLMIGITWPKVVEEGRLHGYFGGANIIRAEPIHKFQEQYTYHGVPETACMIEVLVDNVRHKVRLECSEWEALNSGSQVELVRMRDGIQSPGFMAGHFYFDLGLFVLEFLGGIYFARLVAAQRSGENYQSPHSSPKK